MSPELVTAIIGGFIGGFLGIVGGIVTSYYAPKKLKEWEDERLEERINGPRKRLLLKMLQVEKYKDGRTIENLSLVTGTSNDECRRLLVEIGARGIHIGGRNEGWVLISRKPLDEE